MAGLEKGDQVVAIKDIGGVWREHVPKGSRGAVTEAGWGSPTKVLFTVDGGFWGRDRKVEEPASLAWSAWT